MESTLFSVLSTMAFRNNNCVKLQNDDFNYSARVTWGSHAATASLIGVGYNGEKLETFP